ncbi:hypothetical protein [Kaarinaea lacus]
MSKFIAAVQLKIVEDYGVVVAGIVGTGLIIVNNPSGSGHE